MHDPEYRISREVGKMLLSADVQARRARPHLHSAARPESATGLGATIAVWHRRPATAIARTVPQAPMPRSRSVGSPSMAEYLGVRLKSAHHSGLVSKLHTGLRAERPRRRAAGHNEKGRIGHCPVRDTSVYFVRTPRPDLIRTFAAGAQECEARSTVLDGQLAMSMREVRAPRGRESRPRAKAY